MSGSKIKSRMSKRGRDSSHGEKMLVTEKIMSLAEDNVDFNNAPSKSDDQKIETGSRRERHARHQSDKKVHKLERDNGKLEKKSKMLRMRVPRLEAKHLTLSSPPKSTVKRFLNSEDTTIEHIQNELIAAVTLKMQLQESYMSCSDERSRKLLKVTTRGKITKGSRSIWRNIQEGSNDSQIILIVSRTRRKKSTTMRSILTEFSIKDSTIDTPNKRHVLKLPSGEKIQKRHLNASLADSFTQYKSEHPAMTVCSPTFCKYEPKYIVTPKLSELDTCDNITHVNLGFIIKALQNKKIIEGTSTNQVVESVTCDEETDNCISNGCTMCLTEEISMKTENIDLDEEIVQVSMTRLAKNLLSQKFRRRPSGSLSILHSVAQSVDQITLIY
ncbi:hypothetical protein QAD02_009540 [Eretmocerus hayati]|uniref:Uncharacterized protein n=1 Tax=Eretmocerus hayati TaxID=131215 RepID=A0ACC2N9N2_9HYME|nr:hypothetical protein QAD02_009540 [Eretmocerus hayati]